MKSHVNRSQVAPKPAPKAAAKPYSPPRTPWGDPDLQGNDAPSNWWQDAFVLDRGSHEGDYGLRNILSAARAQESGK